MDPIKARDYRNQVAKLIFIENSINPKLLNKMRVEATLDVDELVKILLKASISKQGLNKPGTK